MRRLSIFLDINEDFKSEVIYTLKNVLFPFENRFKIEKDKNVWLKESYRVLYCKESSSLLSNLNNLKNVIVIILENNTTKYFESKEVYDINYTISNNDTKCIFPLNEKIVSNYEQITLMNFDFIAASYFFLSCWQEKYINKFDKKGRFPLEETVQFKLKIYEKPVVNQYLDLFEKLIEDTWGFKLVKKKFFNKKWYGIFKV